MRKSNKKYEPIKIPYELDEYSLGSWLKKNSSWLIPVGAAVGTALTGGLAAPALLPAAGAASAGTAAAGAGAALAGGAGALAGTTAATAGLGAATGGLSAGAIGAGLGAASKIGGAISDKANQDDAIAAQKQAMQNQFDIQNNNQLTNRLQKNQVQNTPTFCSGGKLKKYGDGGLFNPFKTPLTNLTAPKGVPIDRGDNPILDDSLMGWGMAGTGQELMDYGNLNNPKLYSDITGSEDSEKLTGRYFTALKTGTNTPANQSNPYMETFLDNANKSLGKDRGFFYNPKGSGLAHVTETTNPALYKELSAKYTVPNTNDVSGKRLMSSGTIGVGNKELATRANGGVINYSGQDHSGIDGGIPVDAQGNPSVVSKNRPIALTENKEVTWLTPEGDSYVFSDKLGYSEKANKLISKYKKRLGGKLDGIDELAWKGLHGDLSRLSGEQEAERETRVNKLTGKIDKYKKEMGSYINLVEHKMGGYIDLVEHGDGGYVGYKDNSMMQMEDGSYLNLVEHEDTEEFKKGGWIQKAINPEHKGYCTPMTKSTCTPHRKALAMRFKHGDLHKHEMGGPMTGFLEYADGGPFDPYGLNTAIQYATEAAPYSYRPQALSGAIPTQQPTIDTNRILAATQATTAPEQLTQFTGNVSPLGAIGSMVGNAILAGRSKPSKISLPRTQAEQIDLSQQRATAKENYLNARANMMNKLRSAGLSPAQYTQAVMAGNADLNTVANQTIGQSLENQANTNTQLRGQANQQNAQLASQEAMANAQAQQENDYMKQQYMSNILQAPLNYLGERQRAAQMYDMANAEGKAVMYNDPKNTLAQRLLGLKKYKIKARQ